LIATTTSGGKAGWSPASGPIFESGQAVGPETVTPLAGDLARRTQPSRDLVVAETLARQQYDFRPHHIAIG
jgi:hypothetical protein